MSRDDESYRNMDQQQFDRRREEDEARQDALLDQIHGGVVGLKNQAHAINDEVVEQNVIIDDIGGRMDDATQDISREEEAARQVNARKKKACKLYGVIVVLVVILIIVFVIPGPA
uniref:t-SNARE coiled-coil homology domain-containing protein n=1 Tax=Peronospora matthiolae TaxID=2874970 RepID=A0AAV1TDB2_9STRA